MKKNSLCFFMTIMLFGCSKNEPRRPINPKPSSILYQETAHQSKLMNKLEDSKIAAFIKNDSSKVYLQSSNGFWYTYLHKIEENVPTPQLGDKVIIEYDIKDLNDSVIYSKKELGLKTYKIDKENFIAGLQRGIKLMKTGETITFVIPFYNAFGVLGDGKRIGVNTSIKSTVTLINIINLNNE